METASQHDIIKQIELYSLTPFRTTAGYEKISHAKALKKKKTKTKKKKFESLQQKPVWVMFWQKKNIIFPIIFFKKCNKKK